jgi:hypothetical protein
MKKVALGCGTLLFLFLLIIAFSVHMFGKTLVEHVVISEHLSPDERSKTVIYSSEVGTPPKTAYFISIIPSDEEEFKNLQYNVFALHFLADDNTISAAWHDDHQLNITLDRAPTEDELRRQKYSFNDVSIHYDFNEESDE